MFGLSLCPLCWINGQTRAQSSQVEAFIVDNHGPIKVKILCILCCGRNSSRSTLAQEQIDILALPIVILLLWLDVPESVVLAELGEKLHLF